MRSRESLHQLVDQVDDDTADELLEFAEWLLQEQAKGRLARAGRIAGGED